MARNNDPRKTHEYKIRRRAFLSASEPYCHWCGHEVEDDAPLGHPRKATIDHLVEVSRGQADPLDTSLWVIACWRCNSKRGARFGNGLAPVRRASRAW